jgi:hypothetical protein
MVLNEARLCKNCSHNKRRSLLNKLSIVIVRQKRPLLSVEIVKLILKNFAPPLQISRTFNDN